MPCQVSVPYLFLKCLAPFFFFAKLITILRIYKKGENIRNIDTKLARSTLVNFEDNDCSIKKRNFSTSVGSSGTGFEHLKHLVLGSIFRTMCIHMEQTQLGGSSPLVPNSTLKSQSLNLWTCIISVTLGNLILFL